MKRFLVSRHCLTVTLTAIATLALTNCVKAQLYVNVYDEWVVDTDPQLTYGDRSVSGDTIKATATVTIPTPPLYSSIKEVSSAIKAFKKAKWVWGSTTAPVPTNVWVPITRSLSGSVTGFNAALGGVNGKVGNFARSVSGLNVNYPSPTQESFDFYEDPAGSNTITQEWTCATFAGGSCYYQGPSYSSKVTADSSASVIHGILFYDY